jgi:hypothetical protein
LSHICSIQNRVDRHDSVKLRIAEREGLKISFLKSAGWQAFARNLKKWRTCVNACDSTANLVSFDAGAAGTTSSIKDFHTLMGIDGSQGIPPQRKERRFLIVGPILRGRSPQSSL